MQPRHIALKDMNIHLKTPTRLLWAVDAASAVELDGEICTINLPLYKGEYGDATPEIVLYIPLSAPVSNP